MTKYGHDIELEGNILSRAKLSTTALLGDGEIGFTSAYLKWRAGSVERAIGGNAANALRLDELAVPTASVNANNQQIINVPTPLTGTAAANKDYADAMLTAAQAYSDATVASLDIKGSVLYASTSNYAGSITGNLFTSSGNVRFTIDGATPPTDKRVLLKDQTNQEHNGLYTLTTTGVDGAAPFTLTRTPDADNTPSGEVTTGLFCFVESGTVNAGTGWVLRTLDPITLNTTALTFTQFSAASVITAGNGLVQTVNAFNIVPGNAGLTVAADSISLALAANSGLVISGGLAIDASVAGGGLTHTAGVLAVATANAGIAINADNIELTLAATSGLSISSGLMIDDSIAGDGLTVTSKVLAVGAGTGISVSANAVAIDKDVTARGKWLTLTGDGSTTVFTLAHGFGTSKFFTFAINDTTGAMEVIGYKRNTGNPTTQVDVTITPAPANGLTYSVGFIAVAGT